MPELPEVEAARLLVDRHCTGKVVDAVKVLIEDEIIFKMLEKEKIRHCMQLFCGQKLVSTGRHGKYFWLTFCSEQGGNSTQHLLIHLGMTGFVQVKGVERSLYRSAPEKPGQLDEWPPRFTRFLICFAPGNVEMCFGDARRLGRVIISPDVWSERVIKELGPDPLREDFFDFPAFYDALKRRSVPCKSLLLDQKFIAGIGNWMADDILLMARLHPESIAGRLTEKQAKALHTSIIELSRVAVECKTLGKEYPLDWLFHIRWQRGTPSNTGSTLNKKRKTAQLKIGGRTTVYCPSLQKKTPG